MLKEIFIKNFILIDELKLEFDKGFNVLVGETGAGKSIIFKAIDTALGAKTSRDVLCNPEKNALIELTFEENNEEIIISREISKTGTKPRLNGAMVTLDTINEMREKLVDIHSQHQTYTYIQPKHHIILLDSYIESIDKAFLETLKKYKADYDSYKSVSKKLAELEENEAENLKRVEFLKFQIDEIERAELKEGEEEELNEELNVLSNLEDLKELTYGAYYTLNGDDGSVTDALSKIKYNISKAKECDSSLEEIEGRFIDSLENLRDIANTLRDYSQSLENNPARLDEINERLEIIQNLKRKYGNDIFEEYKKLCSELKELENSAFCYEDLKAKKDELLNSLIKAAEYMSLTRQKNAKTLSALIEEELKKLNMEYAKFVISVENKGAEDDFTANGKDKVEFLITTNVSKELAPLHKTASGGELSRVMLAIKSVFCHTDKVSTIIFDEIDTGISGKTSAAVAGAISKLAQSAQVFAITHQPIIAARADNFYLVSKAQNDKTTVNVRKLEDSEKPDVLAKMAMGDVSDNSLTFAKELLSGS